jgi:hypothetical protein
MKTLLDYITIKKFFQSSLAVKEKTLAIKQVFSFPQGIY